MKVASLYILVRSCGEVVSFRNAHSEDPQKEEKNQWHLQYCSLIMYLVSIYYTHGEL